MTVSSDEGYEPLYFPLRSRRASFPSSLAAASSRTSLSSEGSKSVIVSYKCKQTTSAGLFSKKTKEVYEGTFQRYRKMPSKQRCGKMFSEKDSSSINFDSLNIEMPPAEVRRLYLTELH